jgi:hypothetical protein
MTHHARRGATGTALGLGLGLALLAGAAPAAGPTPTQLLFDTPHFASATVGEALRYQRRRLSDPALGLGPDMTEAVTVTPMAGGATEVTLTPEGGATRRLTPFEGVPGNPLLMVFLENTVRAVAQATGGSPFYLRNRMKEALRAGLSESAGADGLTVLTAQPFAADPNAAKMGPFGGLTLRFELAAAEPGAFRLMRADAAKPDGSAAFLEEFRHAD